MYTTALAIVWSCYISAWYNCYCKTLCKWVVWMVHTWPNNINLYYKPTFTCCHSCLPYCTVLGIVTQDYNLLLLHDTCWGKPCSRWMDGPVSPVKPQVRSVESQRFTKVHLCVCIGVCLWHYKYASVSCVLHPVKLLHERVYVINSSSWCIDTYSVFCGMSHININAFLSRMPDLYPPNHWWWYCMCCMERKLWLKQLDVMYKMLHMCTLGLMQAGA